MPHPQLHQTPAYRNPLAFIVSLNYTDFSTIDYTGVKSLLQDAGVKFEQEAFIVDIFPSTIPGLDTMCELVRETGHFNKVYFSFDDQEVLTDFHLRTFL